MMIIKKPADEKLKNMVFNTVRMANDDATVPNDASEDVVKVSDQATENFYNSEKKKNNVDHMDKSTMYVKAVKTIDDNVKTIHINVKKQMDNCEELFDDTTKIDDENPVDTHDEKMKSSTNLLYTVRHYQVLESVYLLEGTIALLQSRVSSADPHLVMITLMKTLRLPAMISRTFHL